MQVFLGPFHPYLEDRFVAEIRRHKSLGPLLPLLVLVPSNAVRRRLKTLLTLDHRLDLINLQILTFHQLSRHLYEEQTGVSDPDLYEDIFFEETLRNLLRTGYATGSSFSGLDEMEGGCTALWQTLRDLKDGLVDPVVVIQAVKEGCFGKEAVKKVTPLLRLSLDLRDRCVAWGIRDYTDLDTKVIEHVPSSRFLKQFDHIFHYGFYDLTQAQIDQFQSVTRHHPTSLFFPLIKDHPGWVFAQKFYDRYVQTMVGDSRQVTDCLESHPNDASVSPLLLEDLFSEDIPEEDRISGAHCTTTIISCSGTRDETLTVAKEILRLVTDEAVSFGDIGVVTRNLSAYATSIMDIFRRHSIPVSSTAREPVLRFPLAKAVLLLTGLSLKDYLRSEVIDLLSSPYLNIEKISPDGIVPRPGLWESLTRRLGVTKGWGQWKGLKRYIEREANRKDGKRKYDASRSVMHEQAVCLWQTFRQLHQDLEGLPAQSRWSDYAEHWRRLFKKYLRLTSPEERESEPSQADDIAKTVIDTLENLSALDALVSPVSINHFLETFTHWLERASVLMSKQNVAGVSVLEPMSARGLPFKVLFLLGINEGVFPRTIREDAFLRDRERRTFETILGYKVAEKLAGYDEEKLLFMLLVNAARERLYCLYQRSDEQGKPLAPSWYLSELRKRLAADSSSCAMNGDKTGCLQERVIPRSLLEKQSGTPFDRSDLHPPQEIAVLFGLVSQNMGPLFRQLPFSKRLYLQGLKALNSLEDAGKLNLYDGMVGPLPDVWKGIQQGGVTPSALERYAECPSNYFGTQLLGLRLTERPEDYTGLKPSDAGELCHLILKQVYEALIKQMYFQKGTSVISAQKIILRVSKRIFSQYELDNPTGYPVVWEDLKEGIVSLIETVVAQDHDSLSQSGYAPLALEVKCEGSLEGGWPAIIKGLRLQGRIDRIDYHADRKCYRVIDYKLKTGKNQNTSDKNLMQAAVRAQRLQAPLYLLLAACYAAEREKKEMKSRIEAVFYYLAPNWDKGPLVIEEFPADGWEGETGGMLKKSLTLLLNGIHDGRFFIHPGNHCGYCDLSTICRLKHLQSSQRAALDPRTEEHRALRTLKIPKASSAKKGKARPDSERTKLPDSESTKINDHSIK